MKTIREIGKQFGIPVVDAYHGRVDNVLTFLSFVKGLKNLEGFVITFENGHRAKCKADEYVQLHRARDAMSFEKDVWAIILDEKIDDLLPILNQDDQARLAEFTSELNSAILTKAADLKQNVDEWIQNNGADQKKFAVEFVNAPNSKFSSSERGLVFKIKAGKNPVEVVREYVRSQCSTSSTIEGVRSLVGGLRWDYRNVTEEG